MRQVAKPSHAIVGKTSAAARGDAPQGDREGCDRREREDVPDLRDEQSGETTRVGGIKCTINKYARDTACERPTSGMRRCEHEGAGRAHEPKKHAPQAADDDARRRGGHHPSVACCTPAQRNDRAVDDERECDRAGNVGDERRSNDALHRRRLCLGHSRSAQ